MNIDAADMDATKIEERVRADLRATTTPATLVPPPDLAHAVLHRLRRRRQSRIAMTAAAAVIAVTAGVSLVIAGGEAGGGTTQQPGVSSSPSKADGPTSGSDSVAPTFPRPGGGPKVIHVYTAAESYLLDLATGRYRRFPYSLVLSPDGKQVIVDSGERIGLAGRVALLRDGESVIHWLEYPPGAGVAWAPDGSALLSTSIDKSAPTPRFTIRRYDIVTGRTTFAPIDVEILGGSVGWAADSRRYLALLPGKRSPGTVEPGALQYLNPDGSPGPRIDIAGGLVGGANSYSPARSLFFADASDLMSARPLPSPIVDVATGRSVADVPAGSKPIGWYDDDAIVRLTADAMRKPVLEVVDVLTGVVRKTIDVSGLPEPYAVQIGSSAGLAAAAAGLGF